MRVADTIELDGQAERELRILSKRRRVEARVQQRASVILLADTCAGYATVAHLPDGAKGFTTIELKSNFFSTAREGVMRCEAAAEHLGRTTQVWSSTVYGPDGRKMALFRCTQMVLW